jgi:hypothetical protein
MATKGAIYEMDKVERNRLRLVTARLAKRLGLEDVATPERARQFDLQRVYEMRVFNDFLEGLDASIKDEGYTAAAGESKADQLKAEEEKSADVVVPSTQPTSATKSKTTKAKA